MSEEKNLKKRSREEDEIEQQILENDEPMQKRQKSSSPSSPKPEFFPLKLSGRIPTLLEDNNNNNCNDNDDSVVVVVEEVYNPLGTPLTIENLNVSLDEEGEKLLIPKKVKKAKKRTKMTVEETRAKFASVLKDGEIDKSEFGNLCSNKFKNETWVKHSEKNKISLWPYTKRGKVEEWEDTGILNLSFNRNEKFTKKYVVKISLESSEFEDRSKIVLDSELFYCDKSTAGENFLRICKAKEYDKIKWIKSKEEIKFYGAKIGQVEERFEVTSAFELMGVPKSKRVIFKGKFYLLELTVKEGERVLFSGAFIFKKGYNKKLRNKSDNSVKTFEKSKSIGHYDLQTYIQV